MESDTESFVTDLGLTPVSQISDVSFEFVDQMDLKSSKESVASFKSFQSYASYAGACGASTCFAERGKMMGAVEKLRNSKSIVKFSKFNVEEDPFQKNVRKMDAYHGLSVRYFNPGKSNVPRISVNRTLEYINDETAVIIPVSLVEIENNEICEVDGLPGFMYHDAELSKKNAWEMLEFIKDKATNVKFPDYRCRQYNRYHEKLRNITTFEFPVEAELIHCHDKFKIQLEKERKQNARCFNWRGQMFEKDVLYYKFGDSFTPIGSFQLHQVPKHSVRAKFSIKVQAPKEFSKCFKISSIESEIKSVKRINDKLKNNFRKYPVLSEAPVIYLSFAKEEIVTHIGISGRRYEVCSFDGTYFSHLGNLVREKDFPRNRHILCVNECEKQWITRFDAFVRKHNSKDWTKVGEFHGNSDRLTEVVHALEEPMLAQHIKIVVKSYYNAPSACFSLITKKSAQNLEKLEERKVQYTVEESIPTSLANYTPKTLKHSRFRYLKNDDSNDNSKSALKNRLRLELTNMNYDQQDEDY